MTDEFNFGDIELSDDLKALDEELSSIRYEERPSFGPELRAELGRTWAAGPTYRPSSLRRNLIAAGLAALLVGGASVPSARASLVRLIGALSDAPVEVERPVPAPAPFEALVPEETDVVVEEAAEIVAPEPAEVLPSVSLGQPIEPVIVAPEMIDRVRSRGLLQDAYPMRLQRRGVGGTVWLRLWVDETGLPGDATILEGSGVEELDRTALRIAPRFTFAPALQNGRRMGTWIRFPVVFEPDPNLLERELRPAVDPLSLPNIGRDDWWQLRDPLDLVALPVPNGMHAEEAEAREMAEAGLADALDDPAVLEAYGPTRAIMAGEAPEGMAPTEWRSAMGAAFQASIDRGTENPTSFLAFGRIRLRQGLRTEARTLFERGLQIAVASESDISPWVVAELHYERGRLVREGWLAADNVGRVDVEAFSAGSCAQARSSGAAGFGYAASERLVAWNYLCPLELARVFENGFEPASHGGSGDLTLMMASFRAAIESYPGHVGANTDLLMTLAGEERWEDVLRGARRFTRTSGGHANGLLLAGLALHEMGRSAEAEEHFKAGLDRMPEADAAELTDIGFLLDRSELRMYRRLPAEERLVRDSEFWATKDRSPSTEVNERWVEHLARASVARLRFGSVFGDAGEVWVRFGGPTTIHIVDEGSGRLTEFWDYGSGPDITFVRWVSSERTDLTPEGRAYVDDLGKIFPPQ
jgi:TonB family protein